MENDKQLTDLDEVLKFLCTSVYAQGRIGLSAIQVYMKRTYEITSGDLIDCLNQLEEDKYVKSEIGNEGTATYRATWGGKYFQRTLGYKKKIEKENRHKIELDLLQKTSISLSEKMNILTFFVAVGTMGLLAFEIWKYYIEHHCFVCP